MPSLRWELGGGGGHRDVKPKSARSPPYFSPASSRSFSIPCTSRTRGQQVVRGQCPEDPFALPQLPPIYPCRVWPSGNVCRRWYGLESRCLDAASPGPQRSDLGAGLRRGLECGLTTLGFFPPAPPPSGLRARRPFSSSSSLSSSSLAICLPRPAPSRSLSVPPHTHTNTLTH